MWLNNYTKEDPDGNLITYSITSGWTDTNGRSIPPVPIPGGSNSTDTTGCQGPLTTASAFLWDIPGPGGTTQMKVCYADVSVQTDFESTTEEDNPGGSVPMIQSLVLYNGTSWATSVAWIFGYDDRNPGDPSTINYGSLTSVTLPTGGTITYTYATRSNANTTGATTFSRGVTSKIVNANDNTGPHKWLYSLSYSGWGATNIITDPLGNDTVYTLTGLGNTFSFYPTEVDYYQGSHSAGTLLKTMQTNYQFTTLPKGTTSCSQDLPTTVNVAPIRVITIWPNGQQAKTETDLDSSLSLNFGSSSGYTVSYGNSIHKREYDYGPGAPGSLLRTTITSYLAFSNSTYLANNMLSLRSSVQVQDGSGTQRELTNYSFDEGSPATSNISTQHTTPPYANARGLLTSSHKWLNGNAVATTDCPISVSNGYVVSYNSYFDTGTLYQATDQCGSSVGAIHHTTTYSYSSTYAGAYPTTVTNALIQSTYHTYDSNTGLLASTTDPNSQITNFSYDMQTWRSTLIGFPDGGQVTFCYSDTASEGCSSGAPYKVIITKKSNTSPNVVETGTVDGLGRLSEIQLNSDPSDTDYTFITYDADGRKATQTNPYRTMTDATYGITSYSYDALKRITLVTNPDASTVQTLYTGRATEVTDEGNGRSQQQNPQLRHIRDPWCLWARHQ